VHLVLLVVAAVLMAGCTTVVAGSPSAPTGVLLPPRPKEVRLEGVDPCSLLTAEQRVGLGIESEPTSSTPYVALFRGDVPTCTMRGPYPKAVLLGLGTVTSVGIERWQERDLIVDIRSTAVVGFPAVLVVPQRFGDYCSVEVDVGPGQLLDVQFGGGGSQAPIPQEELCAVATRSAELAMISLLAR
jgi:Protein of unknown function (DUF3558)